MAQSSSTQIVCVLAIRGIVDMTRQVLRLLAPLRAGLRSSRVAGHPAAPWCAWSSRGFASDADLKKTPLYDFHVEHGGE